MTTTDPTGDALFIADTATRDGFDVIPEVAATLADEVRRLRRATDHHCADTERELERLRAMEQRARRAAEANTASPIRSTEGIDAAKHILGEW